MRTSDEGGVVDSSQLSLRDFLFDCYLKPGTLRRRWRDVRPKRSEVVYLAGLVVFGVFLTWFLIDVFTTVHCVPASNQFKDC